MSGIKSQAYETGYKTDQWLSGYTFDTEILKLASIFGRLKPKNFFELAFIAFLPDVQQ